MNPAHGRSSQVQLPGLATDSTLFVFLSTPDPLTTHNSLSVQQHGVSRRKRNRDLRRQRAPKCQKESCVRRDAPIGDSFMI